MADAFSYDGRFVEINGSVIKVPSFSEFREEYSCKCFHIGFIPGTNKYFINQTEIKIWNIILATFSISTIFGCQVWNIVLVTKNVFRSFCLTAVCISYFFWVCCYILSNYYSPKRLPWFWSIEQRESYTHREFWAGVVTNADQYNFVMDNVRPERSGFSAESRSIVLGAYQYFPFFGNWISIENIRVVVSHHIWFTILGCLFYFVLGLVLVDSQKNKWSFDAPKIIYLVLVILFTPLFLWFMYHMFFLFRSIMKNETPFEESTKKQYGMEYENPYDFGTFKNCIDIMGPIWTAPFYLFPCGVVKPHDGFNWEKNESNLCANDPASHARKLYPTTISGPRKNPAALSDTDDKGVSNFIYFVNDSDHDSNEEPIVRISTHKSNNKEEHLPKPKKEKFLPTIAEDYEEDGGKINGIKTLSGKIIRSKEIRKRKVITKVKVRKGLDTDSNNMYKYNYTLPPPPTNSVTKFPPLQGFKTTKKCDVPPKEDIPRLFTNDNSEY